MHYLSSHSAVTRLPQSAARATCSSKVSACYSLNAALVQVSLQVMTITLEDVYGSGAVGLLWDNPCSKRRTSLAERNSMMQA